MVNWPNGRSSGVNMKHDKRVWNPWHGDAQNMYIYINIKIYIYIHVYTQVRLLHIISCCIISYMNMVNMYVLFKIDMISSYQPEKSWFAHKRSLDSLVFSYQITQHLRRRHRWSRVWFGVPFGSVPPTAGGTPPCCRGPGWPPGTGKLERPWKWKTNCLVVVQNSGENSTHQLVVWLVFEIPLVTKWFLYTSKRWLALGFLRTINRITKMGPDFEVNVGSGYNGYK